MRVDRAFGFIDLCGFTRFTDAQGDEQAVDVLTRFRAAVRETASDHAVRVDKWLGDGVMLVSTDDDRLVQAAITLSSCAESNEVPLPLRMGLAAGPVILLEGDDYVGSAVNLAARLCSKAAPNEILATLRLAAAVPPGAGAIPVGALEVAGFVQPVEVARIEPEPLATAL
ncbi:MAG: adenylate/guanylate cyclase domain-containing protein [Actinobacteria bacterium]|nr:adenylate/guanylate cyclase domain-containing protein [Actinomycetota bacterium]